MQPQCCSSWSSCFLGNSGQLVFTFLSKNWQKHKKIRVLLSFCFLFTVLMCSNSIFNLLTRDADGSFLFLCKTLVFLFLPFLNLDPQTRCLVNRYIDLKSALDQPLVPVHVVSFFECVCVMSNQSTSIKPLHLTSVNQCLVA